MPSRKGANFWSKFEARFVGRKVVASFEVELLAAEIKITMQAARDTLRRHGWKTMRRQRDPNYYWCHASDFWGPFGGLSNDAVVVFYRVDKEAMKPARVLAYARRRAIVAAARAELRQELKALLAGASTEERAKILFALSAIPT